MKIIDAHAHAFPDALAGRAIEQLEGLADWQAVGAGTVDDLLRSMDAAGIHASVICTIATKPDQVEAIFRWCEQIRGERIHPFLTVHPEMPDGPAWLRRFADAGFRGIKLHVMYQDFTADDPRMDALYDAAAECGIIVTFHAGYDIAFPTDDRSSPQRLRAVLDRHPGLRMLCTHLGGWKMWDEVEQHLAGSAAMFETSYSVHLIGPERAAGLIRAHGADKVMLGSDWPWRRQDESLAAVEGLDLSDAERQAVLSDNAAKMLGI